ncbi:MAG: hypothetical protein ACYC46_05130 [Acidobacteriaceae bacterium]
MPNFITFDDGRNYIAISEIESFGYDYDETNKGGTVIKLRNGRELHSQWQVQEVAEKLGPTANLHY